MEVCSPQQGSFEGLGSARLLSSLGEDTFLLQSTIRLCHEGPEEPPLSPLGTWPPQLACFPCGIMGVLLLPPTPFPEETILDFGPGKGESGQPESPNCAEPPSSTRSWSALIASSLSPWEYQAVLCTPAASARDLWGCILLLEAHFSWKLPSVNPQPTAERTQAGVCHEVSQLVRYRTKTGPRRISAPV